MRRPISFAVLVVAVAVVLGFQAYAQMQHEDHQHGHMMKGQNDEVVCPVTKRVMKVSEAPASYTFYFASEAARDAFLKDPAKFLVATCPVMGGEANTLTAAYSEYDGVAYSFCCAGCREKFEEEPKKYIGKTSQESERPGTTGMKMEGMMVSDPVCGMTISAQASVQGEHRGRAYHFCSAQCREKFEKAPEKYINK